MALPVPDVAQNLFAGGPVVSAMQGMNALATQQLRNQMLSRQLPYVAPEAQAQLSQRQAETQRLNALTPLMAQHQADINRFYGPSMASQIAARQASTERLQEMTPLQVQAAQLRNQLYRPLTEAQISAQHARAELMKLGGAGRAGAGQRLIMGLQRQISQENPLWDDAQVSHAASAYLAGNNVLPDGTKLSAPSGLIQAYVDQIIKKGMTTKGIDQQRFAATTDAILNKGQQLMPIIAQYAGALGKAQGNIDAIQSSLGVNTPAYQQYQYFTRTFVPYAAGEMMRALGVNASDRQKELYQSVINPITWDRNPQSAMKNYNQMVSLFRDTVSKTVGKSPGEIKAQLRASRRVSPAATQAPAPSEADILFTAKKYNMTPEQVKQQLGLR